MLLFVSSLGAADAQASEVGRDSHGFLLFTAAAGERNRVSVEDAGTSKRVTDAPGIVLTPGAGCVPGGAPNVALCANNMSTFVRLDLGDGDDEVVQTAVAHTDFFMLGGPGDDILRAPTGVRSSVTMAGGDGRDQYVAGSSSNFEAVSYYDKTENLSISLDDEPNDPDNENVPSNMTGAVGGSGDDTLTGSDKSDYLAGGRGADHVYGMGGDDLLYGGFGDDLLDGGPGDDRFIADPGADEIVGGDGTDRYEPQVSGYGYYDPGNGRDVDVSLDDVANDGQSGENDNVHSDVENLKAVTFSNVGNATLSGSSGPNVLIGAAGNDTLDPGAGADVVDGAAGDDAIFARDGVADDIACGPGNDSLIADDIDRTSGCENVGNGLAPATAAVPPTAAGPPAPPSSVTSAPSGAVVRPRARPVVRARLVHSRVRHAPYRFTVKGRVQRPSGVGGAAACRDGRVSVQVKAGRRTVSARRAALRGDCRFTSTVAFRRPERLGNGRLRFFVRWLGNGALAPRSARTLHARAG